MNAPEGTTSLAVVARVGRSAGVHRPWHAGREASKHGGGPRSSWEWDVSAAGRQLWGQARGNPDTERCWPLSGETESEPGRQRRPGTGTACRMRRGRRNRASDAEVGQAHSMGKDSTEARSPARQRLPAMSDRSRMRPPPGWPSQTGPERATFSPARTRVPPRNRRREHSTSGSARGRWVTGVPTVAA